MISSVNSLVASALAATCVSGHGYMYKPAAFFSPESGDKTQYIATIDSSGTDFLGVYNTAPNANVEAYTKAFAASKYKSLKELIDDKAVITVTGATLTCGNADPAAVPQPLPAQVEWVHSSGEGFTASHEGPCEVWCDNERAFQDDNRPAHFTTAPAQLPYDKTKCTGASFLTLYWMAMHGPSWQIYVNCAPLIGGSGSPQTPLPRGSSPTTNTNSSYSEIPSVTPSLNPSSTPPSTPSSTPSSRPSTTPSSKPKSTPPSTPSTYSSSTSSSSSETQSVPSPTPELGDDECGSFDIAEDVDECGSLDIAEDVDECGSLDVAGDDEADNKVQGKGSQTNSGGYLNQQDTTSVADESEGDADQNPYQGPVSDSQNSYNFNNVQSNAKVGTVKPQ